MKKSTTLTANDIANVKSDEIESMRAQSISTSEKLAEITSKSGIKTSVENAVVKLEFAHGKKVEANFDELTPELQRMCGIHGLKQKLVDSAAIAKNRDTGASATVEDKYIAVYETFVRLFQDKQWNKARESMGTSNLLFLALSELYGKVKSDEEIQAFYDSLKPSQRAAMMIDKAIEPKIKEIQERRAAVLKDVDTDSLLSGFLASSQGSEESGEKTE